MAKRMIVSVQSVEVALLKSEPPQLLINVTGWAGSTGWHDPELVLQTPDAELSADGVLDLEFQAEPPPGGLKVLTPISASYLWQEHADDVVAVRVVARTNEITELVRKPVFTTLALGEETPVWPMPHRPPTTWALGEETPTGPQGMEQFPSGRIGEHFPPSSPVTDDPRTSPWDQGWTDPEPWRSPFGRW
ncbi:hypothetical protein [Steroidobacter cummioxidans]|uniref:hypothetical protein n=1 Tax=Steroidobacter cummioxidans TaxID=1803913 RepID=UPI000E317028|nr:hypothetical protein [Steroidobacter cummioxidans]